MLIVLRAGFLALLLLYIQSYSVIVCVFAAPVSIMQDNSVAGHGNTNLVYLGEHSRYHVFRGNVRSHRTPASEDAQLQILIRRKSVGAKIREGLKKTGEAIKNGFKKVGHAIKTGFQKFGQTLKKGFKKVGHAIKTGFQKFGHAVKTTAKKVWNGVKTAAKKVGTFFKTTGAKIAKFTLKVVSTVASVGARIVSIVPGIGKVVGKALQGISKGTEIASNKIHANLGKLEKHMAGMDKVLHPVSGKGGKILDSILKRESVLIKELDSYSAPR